MARHRNQVLDTSMLIRRWRRSRTRATAPIEIEDVLGWASEVIGLYLTNAIVTPVYLEFVAGTHDASELARARAFLARFRIIDEGRIVPEDWIEARRLAERVPNDGKPRQLGDCLIRAIARRLKHDVITLDAGFPR